MSIHPYRSGLSRRTLVLGSMAGVGAAVTVALPAWAAPNYTVIPRLPGEITRTSTAYSRSGRKPYEVIDVSISGDRTRLFVPHSAKPSLSIGRGFIWFYHSLGGDHTALSSAFAYAADQAVDRGVISICPTYRGSRWTSRPAIDAQTDAVAWVRKVWRIGISFLRANSGGGPLLAWAYGKRLVPSVRGAYLVNATYDMEERATRGPETVMPYYDYDMSLVRATNPMRLPQSVWAKTRFRIVGSVDDQVVPFEKHGARLYRRALPVAKEATIVYRDGEGSGGHGIPSFANNDMLTTFQRWQSEGPA